MRTYSLRLSTTRLTTYFIPAAMTNVIQAVDSGEPTLPEEFVQECFHSYLKSSLTHAKLEGLLDEETLSSAEGDLMITGTFFLPVL